MGKIVRALANNDNTPTKAKNLMAEAANNGWFKAVNLDVDPTYSQEMKLKLVERRLEICKESIDDTMLPYLRRYCYNCIFTDAENGVRRIEELYETIRLGGPVTSSKEFKIAKMCMKKVAVKAGPDK